MINVNKAIAYIGEDDNVVLRFIGDDEKRYDNSLSLEAVTEVIAALLAVEGIIFQGSLQFDVGDKMQPILVIGLGGIEIPVEIPVQQLTALHEDISQLIAPASTKH